jgi:hypothetical protein
MFPASAMQWPAMEMKNAAFIWGVTYAVSWQALGNEQSIGKLAFSSQRGGCAPRLPITYGHHRRRAPGILHA